MTERSSPWPLEMAARRPILVVAGLKSVASILFLVACVLVMLLSTPRQKVRTHMYMSTSWSPLLYVGFCVLHVAVLGLATRQKTCTFPRFTTLIKRYERYMSPDTLRACCQSIETTTQVLQAYNISRLCVDRDIVLVYALLISASCLIVPWLFFSSNPFVKTTLVLTFNSLVSFGVAVGISMVRFLPPLLMAVTGDVRITYSPVWVTRNILQARFLLPTSGIDLFEKCILLAASLINVRRLVVYASKIPVRKTNVIAVLPPATRRSSTSSTTSFSMKLAQSLKVPMLRHSIELSLSTVQEVKRSLEFERKRLLKVFLLYQLLIGLLMLAAAIDTLIVPTHCPSSCKLETRPLFSHTCTCAYLAINCADAEALAAFHGDLAHALAPGIWGDALFYLQISQCSLPTGLDLQLLAPYPNLNVLSIEFSNMTSWDASPNGTWPPSLFAVNLRYGNLSSIPSVLQTPPPTLQTIGLLGHPLQSISPDVLRRWTGLTSLILGGTKLTSLPIEVTRLVHLETFILIDSSFTEIPAAWATSFPLLQRYELSGNAISSLPTTLLDAKPKALIDLSNNPIRTVPASAYARIATRQILLDGTPFCATQHVEGCRSACAETCSALNLGNNVCTLGCFSAACAWDGDDCTRFGVLDVH